MGFYFIFHFGIQLKSDLFSLWQFCLWFLDSPLNLQCMIMVCLLYVRSYWLLLLVTRWTAFHLDEHSSHKGPSSRTWFSFKTKKSTLLEWYLSGVGWGHRDSFSMLLSSYPDMLLLFESIGRCVWVFCGACTTICLPLKLPPSIADLSFVSLSFSVLSYCCTASSTWINRRGVNGSIVLFLILVEMLLVMVDYRLYI